MSKVKGFSGESVSDRTPADRSFASRPGLPSCGVAVMAKASSPGLTKTRLVPPLNFEEAAAFNTAFLQDIADNLLAAGRATGISAYMAFGPPGSEGFFRRTLPASIGFIGAWLPNFGDCLLLAIEQLLLRGHHAAVVLNSDSPTLPTSLLVETAEMLARPGDRAVIGPSSDGGYYLLGLKQVHRRMFEDIAWSTERVAQQTLERARQINLDIHVLPTWYDVDDVDTLRTLHSELQKTRSMHDRLAPYYPRQTAALMDLLCHEGDFAIRIERFKLLEKTGA